MRGKRRPGLAPLEFVMWLPILLFVMALMVNFGTLVTWRVRGEIVSRNAVWRARWPRNSGSRPYEYEGRAPHWKVPNATMSTVGGSAVTAIDFPELNHPVIRGPIPNGFIVNPTLDPTRGARIGIAELTRGFPMLGRMGQYESGDIMHPLIDGKWQHATMGVGSTRWRRIKTIYELPKTDPSLSEAFGQAVQDTVLIPNYDALRVLDNDEDFIRYRGRAPNFIPRARHFCSNDRAEIYREVIARYRPRRELPLIDIRDGSGDIVLGRISNLPVVMTNAFLSLYEARKQYLEGLLQANPPPDPATIASIQQELQELNTKIGQLEQYRDRLPQILSDLEARANAAIP